MKHDGSVSGATHARIRNPDHVRNAFAQQFGRYRHIPNFRHARVAARAAVLKHHHAVFIDVQAVVIDSSVEFFDILENHGAPAMLKQSVDPPPKV